MSEIGRFLANPGAYFQQWASDFLTWFLAVSFDLCLGAALLGLLLKMFDIDYGLKILKISLASYVIINAIGAMLSV